jgi:hypothetical protein
VIAATEGAELRQSALAGAIGYEPPGPGAFERTAGLRRFAASAGVRRSRYSPSSSRLPPGRARGDRERQCSRKPEPPVAAWNVAEKSVSTQRL